VRGERGQEPAVAQQGVDPGEVGGQPEKLGGQDRLPQQRLRGWWSAALCLQSLVAQWIRRILSSFDLSQQLKPNQKLLVRRQHHGTFFSTK
jgi:hypothetical protein